MRKYADLEIFDVRFGDTHALVEAYAYEGGELKPKPKEIIKTVKSSPYCCKVKR
jgi:hypothetical protein